MQSHIKDLKSLSSSISEALFIKLLHVHYMLEESHWEIKSNSSITKYWSESLETKCLRGDFLTPAIALGSFLICLPFSRHLCGKGKRGNADLQHGHWMKNWVSLSQICLQSNRTWISPWEPSNEINVDRIFWLLFPQLTLCDWLAFDSPTSWKIWKFRCVVKL